MPDSAKQFNLIDSPWLLALTLDDRLTEISLGDAIVNASRYKQLVGEIPTQVFAIERLVLAVLHRAVEGPQDIRSWRAIRDSWDQMARLALDYLDVFRDRFYLVHPSAPFFQVAGLHTAKNEWSGLEKLITDVPNGAPYLTTRLASGLASIDFGEAARWLVHTQAFDTSGIRSGAVGDPRAKSGRGYPIGPGWAAQIGGVILQGDSLVETLQLNLMALGTVQVRSGAGDLPPWERAPLSEQEEVAGGRQPTGLVDLYTWQARRIRLDHHDGKVTGLVLAQGDGMRPQNRQDVEPMSAWRFSDLQTKKLGGTTYMPRLHDPSREFWRGLSALLPQVASNEGAKKPAPTLQPELLRWVGILRADGAIPDDQVIHVRAVGLVLGSKQSVVDEVVDDILSLPASILNPGCADLVTQVLDAVERTDQAVRALASLAGNLAHAAGLDPKSMDPLDRARERAYAALDAPFREWLVSLTSPEDSQASATRWTSTARSVLWALSRDLVESVGPAAWKGRAVNQGNTKLHVDLGQADAWFRTKLSSALPRAQGNDQEVKSA